MMVFDYNKADTVSKMIDILKNKTCVGALAIGVGSLEACIDIIATIPGRKFISQASNPVDLNDMHKSKIEIAGLMLWILWWNVSITFKAKLKQVTYKFIWGSDLIANEVGPMIYQDFLQEVLATGKS
jgi:hypothetical protein